MRKVISKISILLIAFSLFLTIVPINEAKAYTLDQFNRQSEIINCKNEIDSMKYYEASSVGGYGSNPYDGLYQVTGVSTSLNVRSDPGTHQFIVIGSLFPNEYVVKYGGKGNWSLVKYKVVIKGIMYVKFGWVSNDYLYKVPFTGV